MANTSWRSGLQGLCLVGLAGLAGCLADASYPCAADLQCVETDRGEGECVVGWCAYPDPACDSLLRFSPNAGNGLASRCVPPDGETEPASGTTQTDASSTTTTSEPTSSTAPQTSTSSSGAEACPDGCSSSPGPCFSPAGICTSGSCEYAPLGEGTACDDLDACTASSSCDGAGECVGTRTTVCESPPACFLPGGTCNPADGTCTYMPADLGTSCEDGDGCTLDDACDGAGACVPGGPCASDDPCLSSTCQDGACVESPVADATLCGATDSMRCCSGACVDISSDEANCGGCGVACTAAFECETVAATACESAPAATTGRCRCTGFNAQCPNGQICRTFTPFDNRCTPDNASDCPGVVVEVNLCPDYCDY